MLAISVLTLVLTFVLFWAVMFSTLPTIWPAEVLSVIPPWRAASVTLAEPAITLAVPVRLPLATLIEISPSRVTMSLALSDKSFVSLTMSD